MEYEKFIRACENNNVNKVKLLLRDQRVDPSDNENEAIIEASMYGHWKVVKLLLQDTRVDPSDSQNNAIIEASRNGHLEVVKLLLHDSRVAPSDQDNEAIIEASENGHWDVVKLLNNDSRVVIDNIHEYAIIIASIRGDKKLVQRLLNAGANPVIRYNLAIIGASANGHADVVELLLQNTRVFTTSLNQQKNYDILENTMLNGSSESGKILAVLYMIYHGVFRRTNTNRDFIQKSQKDVLEQIHSLLKRGTPLFAIVTTISYATDNLQMLYNLYNKINLRWGNKSDKEKYNDKYTFYIDDLSDYSIKELLSRMRNFLEKYIERYIENFLKKTSKDDNIQQNKKNRRFQ